ncbi:MAG: B12-binding domain-containing radical SAM protein [Candidatus Xenobiia bacterium LiM19]
MIRKYLLVESQKLWRHSLPAYKIDLPADVVQPLGLIQLASVIRERDPHAEIRILDLRLFENDFYVLPRIVKEFKPDFVGFRGVTRDAPFMYDMVKNMRYLVPDAVLVGGGPHISAVKGKALDDAPFDYAVYGEGEVALPQLLDCLERKSGFQDVPNLIFRDGGGGITVNPQGPFIQNLDELPMPAWDLLDHEQYFAMNYFPDIPINLNARREIVSIFTSRGCPFKCMYCHNIFGKKFRARSAQNVVDEIEYLYNTFGIRQFDIRDDIFNLYKSRVFAICDMILERGLDIRFSFPNGLRADLLDEEIILKMKSAGLYRLNYALETASPRLQKMIKKHINLVKLREMIHFTSAQNILTNLFVMLGFPTETKEEMMMTTEYCLDDDIDFIHVFTVNPFDGNEMAEILRSEGYNLDSLKGKYDYFSVDFSVCELSKEELEEVRSELLLRFFTPEKITRTLQKLSLHLV